MLKRDAEILRLKWLMLLLGITLAGCGQTVVVDPDGSESGGNSSSSSDGSSSTSETSSQTQPVQTVFQQARIIDLNANQSTQWSGSLASSDSVDVWDLGPMEPGTRVTVDLKSLDGGNFSVGMFDEEYQVLMVNRDRWGSVDPYAQLTVREGVDVLYLVVSSDANQASSGDYEVTVSHAENQPISEQESQKVVLTFNGANDVYIGTLALGYVPPFDAADLHEDWGQYTEAMKQIVMDHMQQVYAGLNIEFYFDDDPDLPSESEISRVYFGAKDDNNVGLAANVDYGNNYKQQNAVVYTQNFGKYIDYGYSYKEIAQGYANVACHELGHLLGCNHTDIPSDVMNVSPTVAALLAPQYFMESAALDPLIFPTGNQDGAWMVYKAVGGDWDEVLSARTALGLAAANQKTNPIAHRDARHNDRVNLEDLVESSADHGHGQHHDHLPATADFAQPNPAE